jgi:hypothetical protein
MVKAEAVFLVAYDHSRNELWVTNNVFVNELLKTKLEEFLVASRSQKWEL